MLKTAKEYEMGIIATLLAIVCVILLLVIRSKCVKYRDLEAIYLRNCGLVEDLKQKVEKRDYKLFRLQEIMNLYQEK